MHMHIPMSIAPDLDADLVASLVPLKTPTWQWQNQCGFSRHAGPGPAHRRARGTLQLKCACWGRGVHSRKRSVCHWRRKVVEGGPLPLTCPGGGQVSHMWPIWSCVVSANLDVPCELNGPWGPRSLSSSAALNKRKKGEKLARAPTFYHPHWGQGWGVLWETRSPSLIPSRSGFFAYWAVGGTRGKPDT